MSPKPSTLSLPASLPGLEQVFSRTPSPCNGSNASRTNKALPKRPKRSSSIYSAEDIRDIRQSLEPEPTLTSELFDCHLSALEAKNYTIDQQLEGKWKGETDRRCDSGMGVVSIGFKSPLSRASSSPERGRNRFPRQRDGTPALQVQTASHWERRPSVGATPWADEYTRAISARRKSMLAALDRELAADSPLTAIWTADDYDKHKSMAPKALSVSDKSEPRSVSRFSDSSETSDDTNARALRDSFRAYARKYLRVSPGHFRVHEKEVVDEETMSLRNTPSPDSTIRTLHSRKSSEKYEHSPSLRQTKSMFEIIANPGDPPPRIRPTLTRSSTRKSNPKSPRSPAIPLSPYQIMGVKAFKAPKEKKKLKTGAKQVTQTPVTILERFSPLKKHREKVAAERWREEMKKKIILVGNVPLAKGYFDFEFDRNRLEKG
jgi:hypothetical protein